MKLIALGLLAACSAAAAELPAIPPAARLAATCAACHGTAGQTQGSTLPALAGQPQQALSASLLALKTGKRGSTIMNQIAKGYTDEQIEQLAAYFAAQKKPEAAK
ncbi:c-type cytochrome [Duganella sp.]|uniref:c-type cytochrome n=1 Tax=Duganella sp. TaxID=1904440 RepID=UPI0031DB06AB